MRRAIVLLAAAALQATAATAEAAGAKAHRARLAARPPTQATEPQIVADLIRACARDAWYTMHLPPPRRPYTRDGLIRSAHQIGNVTPRKELEGSISSNEFDDCAMKRRVALYHGAPLLGPLERLPPVQQVDRIARLPR